MTTPNTNQGQSSEGCIPAIPVDGAPGGRFYAQSTPGTLKLICAHCGKKHARDKMPFSCQKCLVCICEECVGFGYDQVHACKDDLGLICAHCGKAHPEDKIPFTCQKCLVCICEQCVKSGHDKAHACDGRDEKQGIRGEHKPYICYCGSEPRIRNCETCLAGKVKKYNCFNCDQPKKATLVCGDCFNHFICSRACHENDMSKTHNHAMTCGKALPVWCKHGKPILLSNTGLFNCNCQMCEHGRWSEDCHECFYKKKAAGGAGKRRSGT